MRQGGPTGSAEGDVSIPAVYLEGSASMWDYYVAELESSEFDSNINLKRRRMSQLLRVPWNVEKLLWFGVAICLDALLHVFSIMPARFVRASLNLTAGVLRDTEATILPGSGAMRRWLTSAQLFDMYRGLLLISTCAILWHIDAAQLYHSIRAQSSLKLYFIFSALDIFDRLLSSFGHDALDALQSTVSDPWPQRWRSGAGYFAIAQCYMLVHTLVLFYQVITLNVAVNAYSDQLLSLLISNQFVEIKSNVFKKWEKEMLFQIGCADIVERFQQIVFLFIIILRNLAELSGTVSFAAATPSAFSPLIPSWVSMPVVNRILTPVLMVLGTELLIDWIKHAFVTKLNWIRPEIYSYYIDILSRDMACSRSERGRRRTRSATKPQLFVDQSSRVARRLGLAPQPLACMVILMLGQVSHILVPSSRPQHATLSATAAGWTLLDIFAWAAIGLIAYALTVWSKLAFSSRLMHFAWNRHRAFERRAAESGEGAKTSAGNLKRFDDATKKQDREDFMEVGKIIAQDPSETEWEQQRPKWTLDNIERYSLFKSRIT
ncbi:DUF747-domain-containing protein [Coemansia reversa NRRL 1564]|uniref:DUF747-domain-containing protein n=1 Tax=Coemansia reversa (strain ATCC 12441 / NRRL 1564) TaxID=763665 RepID=A0A2G5BJL7_COERN|nr:DUF747-domain-containing protein [Coemansia reversa NRRL 1564]|eukprot:PIA19171.1 DUF747-domain-containing protein [Coemansia reversa NRRL 1564]